MSKEAMQLALEWLEHEGATTYDGESKWKRFEAAKKALKEALAQPEQEQEAYNAGFAHGYEKAKGELGK